MVYLEKTTANSLEKYWYQWVEGQLKRSIYYCVDNNHPACYSYLDFFYHADGTPLGFDYHLGDNTATYYYVLGYGNDVEMIVDANGDPIVNYSYDAFGCLNTQSKTIINGFEEDAINMNPFQYRCYMYDKFSGFYNLGSRFYDPATGRFISGDTVLPAPGETVKEYNLFAYCSNDPVKLKDPDGHDAILVENRGKGGLPIVGHTFLIIIENGRYYLTEFDNWDGGDSIVAQKRGAKIYFYELEELRSGSEADEYWDLSTLKKSFGFSESSSIEEFVNAMIAAGSGDGWSSVYLRGDYTNSLWVAQAYSKSEAGFGKYNLLFNNCCHYVETILRAGYCYNTTLQTHFTTARMMIPVSFVRKTRRLSENSSYSDHVLRW